jgi:cytochrome c biogenesis protein CcdA
MAGLLASGEISRFFQKYLNQILGPVLILVGMVLLGLIGSTASLQLVGQGVQARARSGGVGWAFVLGVLFALSFCPVSAGLFFGALLMHAAAHESRVLAPALFGVGTAVPVIAFAFLLTFGSRYVGKAFDRLTQVERWVRAGAGVAFILAGLYYSLTYVYGISLTVW